MHRSLLKEAQASILTILAKKKLKTLCAIKIKLRLNFIIS